MKFIALTLLALLPCLAASPAIDKNKATGNPGAPIVMEIYSSFDCPHCKIMHESFEPMVVRDFVVTGKVYLVKREFPLSGVGHQFAREAAQYATAAARIGKYNEVADALYKNQIAWSQDGKVWPTVASVLTAAEQAKVQALSKEPGVVAEVQQDYDSGVANAISSTPTLIVTHKGRKYPFSGVPPSYEFFKKFIDDLLAK
jgi:protein-disulfide isomerase